MRIALIGYGKMGHMVEQIALDRGHQIVCKIDADNQSDFNSPEFASADVAIEFTTPATAYGNYLRAFEHDVKVVSGSTGWMNEHKEDVERLCGENGKTLFWASNFSVGVAIFAAVNRYLAKLMNDFPQYNVEIEETHHIHKLDAPSGTAITLAEGILENIDRKQQWVEGPSAQRRRLGKRKQQSGRQRVAHCVDSPRRSARNPQHQLRLRGRQDYHYTRCAQP